MIGLQKKRKKDKNQNIAYLPCHSLSNLWRSEEHRTIIEEEHTHAEEGGKPKAEQIPWGKLSVQPYAVAQDNATSVSPDSATGAHSCSSDPV